jgi:NSS family neurotransmitter:Na+ symporter
MLYYSVVIAWCVNYTGFAFNLAWGEDANAFFFQEYLQKSSGPDEIGDIVFPIVMALVGVWVMSWLVVFFGVQKGVERANKVFMPLLFVLIILLVVLSLRLEGAWDGVRVYLTPKFESLTKLQVWIDAFSQIFFTLSLSFGIMITYASYLPRKVNIVKDAVVISIGDCLFSFIAGFAVFGTLGYMSHVTGKPIDEVVTQAIGLAFVTYPQAISSMPDGFANFFGVLFFVSLVVAGLSSAVSLIEAFSAAIIDKFHYSREVVVTIVCFVGFLGSLIFTAQSGLYWVDIVDHFINQYGLVVIGILECILLGWIYKISKLREHLESAGQLRLSLVWEICIKYVIPIALTVLFINYLQKDIAAPYEGYPWVAVIMIGRDWVMIALIVALFMAMQSWRTSLDEDDEK